ncbi:hypothetical protein ACQP1O_12165 [Nocardia sp. CA-151230]
MTDRDLDNVGPEEMSAITDRLEVGPGAGEGDRPRHIRTSFDTWRAEQT